VALVPAQAADRRSPLPALAGAGLAATALAGAQIEEPLIDSVRNALSSAIHNKAPPVPEFAHRGAAGLPALAGRDERTAQEEDPDWQERKELLQTIWYEASARGSTAWCSG
jgi:hypothetical protein